ncbi:MULTISPECIES: hypothetical protein [unclassified Massilia]|uniref:hypothetical protein n=1 Tax=unclassified Massilia TaxID=2609279 RepID=UPI0017837138|nr:MULTISPECIES: hypothetical protein [unclassified Massilia]MBD8529427.1 hypothetical protein [Massilia sp. CFBP 13647]MBD8672820.1 hypothetical protein [Massilia sp. CFBP 13721]
MSQITLVLPFALPIPEFAPDLVRALSTPSHAPALAALLSRTRSHARVPVDDAIRALPHEQWLARELGLSDAGRPAFAAQAMGACGLQPEAGTWFIVNPVHIEIARTHLMMGDPASLRLPDADSRALFEAALPYVEEAGHTLLYGDAQTWFLRADEWTGLDTATPDATLGMDLTDWMPIGERAAAFRRLQNEVQILWHTHPVNAAREARRQAPVNAFWIWGAADAARRKSPAAPKLATFDAHGAIALLADTRVSDLAGFIAQASGDTILYCANAAPYAVGADWGGWIAQLQQLEAALFAPILEALKKGRVREVKLVLSHRDAHAQFSTTALVQRTFWRRPTLDRLL